MTCPRPIRPGWIAALACVLALAGRSRPALADDAEDSIRALIAQNRAADALPIALARARTLGVDVAAWEQVRTLAGWTSNEPAALESLQHLVRLQPDDRAVRLALAQRLLWAHRTAEALPHAQWLVAQSAERDPVALEVATWILLGQRQQDLAHEVLLRWIVAAPSDPRPRWILADMTHWTAAWRESRRQYDRLLMLPNQRVRAMGRLDQLRHDHPNEARADGVWWRDTVGVSYAAAAADATAQLPARLVLLVRSEVGRWSQDTGATIGSVGVVTNSFRLRLEASDAFLPEISAGVEADTAGNVAPIGSAGLRLNVAGRLFGSVWFGYDRFRVSLDAALLDIRSWGPAWNIYAEPVPVLFVATEGAALWLSDGNQRTRALLAVGMHNHGPWQLEPRAYVQYDAYRELRANATPYFTPTAPFTAGADVTGRYTLGTRVLLEAGMGIVVQNGVVALRPSTRIRLELAHHLRLSLLGGYVGSPQYSQLRFDASLGYLF